MTITFKPYTEDLLNMSQQTPYMTTQKMKGGKENGIQNKKEY